MQQKRPGNCISANSGAHETSSSRPLGPEAPTTLHPIANSLPASKEHGVHTMLGTTERSGASSGMAPLCIAERHQALRHNRPAHNELLRTA
jgi:hypothetical protein